MKNINYWNLEILANDLVDRFDTGRIIRTNNVFSLNRLVQYAEMDLHNHIVNGGCFACDVLCTSLFVRFKTLREAFSIILNKLYY